METIKNYIISISIILGLILISSFLINVLNYFDILSKGAYKALLIFLSILSVATGSYILGNKSKNKGYLNGLILGLIIIGLFLSLSIIFNKNLNISSAIYYLIILVISIIAAAIGINKKTTHNNK